VAVAPKLTFAFPSAWLLLMVWVCASAAPLQAQKVYTYVGRLASDSALIAWGKPENRGNSIGRDSTPIGKGELRIDNRTFPAEGNWVIASGLKPDTEYEYEVLVDGKQVAKDKIRTLPAKTDRLAFFVIGDYGNGSRHQRSVAKAMWDEYKKRRDSNNPVRFVLTTGDNIYVDLTWRGFRNSGNEDRHWVPKFFEPYEELIRQIPFYPTLGNHDGNESESRGDLAVYLDNFFFPMEKAGRHYSFTVGGLAEFFGLDTTSISEDGEEFTTFLADGEQSKWLAKTITESKAPWKIPYFHHPPFTAGPRHGSSYRALEHWVRLFSKTGVKVVFNGHEHNFQMSQVNDWTGGVLYIVTGAGGELRSGRPRNMSGAGIAGWAAVPHFLAVEIEGDTMRITPIAGSGSMNVIDPSGKKVDFPIVLRLGK
jgi:tartrate-resistant acid phosphatase type 5